MKMSMKVSLKKSPKRSLHSLQIHLLPTFGRITLSFEKLNNTHLFFNAMAEKASETGFLTNP